MSALGWMLALAIRVIAEARVSLTVGPRALQGAREMDARKKQSAGQEEDFGHDDLDRLADAKAPLTKVIPQTGIVVRDP